jgi:ketosteroid isomerase-like protein
MRYGRLTVILVLALFLWLAAVVHGQDLAAQQASQDLAGLQQSFTAHINALNARNVDAALAAVNDQVVLFGIFSPFPIAFKEPFRKAVQEYLETYDSAVITPIDPDYKAIGATGVAWGNFRLATRRKSGGNEYADGRYMLTYTRVNGKWQAISMHYSLLEPLVK